MTSALPENWQELMAGYALGDLSPEEAEEMQRLLAENPGLTLEVASLQEVLALVPYALSQQDPSPQLRDRILAAAASPQQEAEPSTSLSASSGMQAEAADLAPADAPSPIPLRPAAERVIPNRQNPWFARAYALGGAIAAVALLALGVDNYRLRQESQEAKSVIAALRQRGTQTYTLEGTQQATAASGSLVVAPGQRVIIVAKNLPVLPAGQVYRLWAMPANGKNPTFCGQFNASTEEAVTTQWLAPETACQSTTVQMLITSEKAADPPVPKGTLVMQSRI
ncbi:MAG TPA: anti-sigma factor [Coleofasciculaceae cyanobacterium]